MKRKTAIWIAADYTGLLVLTLSFLLHMEGKINATPEDFRKRLSSAGSMEIGWEDKQITVTGENKQALVTLLNSLTIEPILGGPAPTPAPGYLFSIKSMAEDGTEEASICIQGQQEIREYRGEKIFDYKLPEQDYLALCDTLDELF